MAKRGTRAGIEGGKELAARLKQTSRQATNEIEQALVTSGLRVERDAKINAPVDTGRLRSSITSRLIDNEDNNPVVEVGTSVSYAPIIELGSSKAPAQPFLFPAYNGNKQKILKELANALKRGTGL